MPKNLQLSREFIFSCLQGRRKILFILFILSNKKIKDFSGFFYG